MEKQAAQEIMAAGYLAGYMQKEGLDLTDRQKEYLIGGLAGGAGGAGLGALLGGWKGAGIGALAGGTGVPLAQYGYNRFVRDPVAERDEEQARIDNVKDIRDKLNALNNEYKDAADQAHFDNELLNEKLKAEDFDPFEYYTREGGENNPKFKKWVKDMEDIYAKKSQLSKESPERITKLLKSLYPNSYGYNGPTVVMEGTEDTPNTPEYWMNRLDLMQEGNKEVMSNIVKNNPGIKFHDWVKNLFKKKSE